MSPCNLSSGMIGSRDVWTPGGSLTSKPSLPEETLGQWEAMLNKKWKEPEEQPEILTSDSHISSTHKAGR